MFFPAVVYTCATLNDLASENPHFRRPRYDQCLDVQSDQDIPNKFGLRAPAVVDAPKPATDPAPLSGVAKPAVTPANPPTMADPPTPPVKHTKPPHKTKPESFETTRTTVKDHLHQHDDPTVQHIGSVRPNGTVLSGYIDKSVQVTDLKTVTETATFLHVLQPDGKYSVVRLNPPTFSRTDQFNRYEHATTTVTVTPLKGEPHTRPGPSTTRTGHVGGGGKAGGKK